MVKIGDTVKVRSAMSKHNGDIGEIVDTNMFGQFKVEFEDGFVHPYESSELTVVEPDKVQSKPTENVDQQQNTDVKIIHVAIGDTIPNGNWKLMDIGAKGITLESVVD